MMHGRGKSDPAIVAVKPTNKAGAIRLRSRWSEGRGPRGMRASKARAGHRTGEACHRRWNAYGKPQGKGRRRGSPRSSTTSASTCFGQAFFELKEERRARRGRPDVAGLRGRPRAQARGPARTGPSGSVSGTAVAAGLHTQAGWPAAPARGRRPGGQDRPTGDGRGAERDLRGRLPRVLVWVPARARPARCAGRAGGRDHQHEGELDTGRRHPIVLRRVSQEWLVRFLEHRIGDRRIIRLIQKWLKAGILEDGVVTVSDRGTGQGSVISPLLANIYLHYVFDLWAERWRRREATGDMIIVRYADDIIVGFEHETDARRFLGCDARAVAGVCAVASSGQDPPDRVWPLCGGATASSAGSANRRPSTSWASPSSAANRAGEIPASNGRPGATACGRSSRRSRRSCDGACISPFPEQGKWLRQVVTGYFNYHAVPTNFPALAAFRLHVTDLWRRTLRRRSQKDGSHLGTDDEKLADDWLPKPRILHPWPERRFAVKHPRWEPYAGKPHVRICAGRGSYRQHATKGIDVNKGDPSGSSASL